MPTYTPRNLYVLCAAFAGCQSGILGQTLTGSTTPSYWQDTNNIALAWAESFDTAWATVVDAAPNSYELSAIEELSKTYWLPRTIGPAPANSEAATYDEPVDIIISQILNGESTLNGAGITPPPTPTSAASVYGSQTNFSGGTVAIAAGTSPGTIVVSKIVTPLVTGKFRVIAMMPMQSTNEGGDTGNLAISHGVSPVAADFVSGPVSVPGPVGFSAQGTMLAEYGTGYANSAQPAFPVGTPVQFNLSGGSTNGFLQVLQAAAQIYIQELS